MAYNQGSMHRIRGVALPLLVALLLGAPARAAAPDTLPVHHGSRFVLYADDAGELRTGAAQLESAIGRLQTLLGDMPPPLTVAASATGAALRPRLPDSLQRGGALLEYAGRVAPWERRAGSPGPAPRTAEDSLRSLAHEAVHAQFALWVDAVRARWPDRVVGGAADPAAPRAPAKGRHARHPVVPDWFEEAVATACEPLPVQQRRNAMLAARLDRRIPFERLLSMPQPAAGSAEALMFSAQSLSLGQFIAATEFTGFTARIARGLAFGQPFGATLTDARVLLARPDVLEQQWLEWFQKRSRPPAG
jgi:hypothetical protein